MTNVVVAGSNNDNSFAVIAVSSPASPAKALVTPPFQGGCMVDASGQLAVAANYNGGQVAVYDVSNPASPVFQGSVTTTLGGIGAVSADGTRVLVGDVNGLRAAMIDISNPASPQILSVFTTAIDSIGPSRSRAPWPSPPARTVSTSSCSTTPTRPARRR